MPSIVQTIKEQAIYLASENRKADPSIQKVYWFPHPSEIRLVELTDDVPADMDGEVRPIWFRASPQHGLTAPSGIALIRPAEFGALQLPRGWPAWQDAQDITHSNGNGAHHP